MKVLVAVVVLILIIIIVNSYYNGYCMALKFLKYAHQR